MAFEVYKKGSAPVATVPAVTIQKRGLMSLNKAAHELLGSPEAVELLWDGDRRVVGFRAATIESPNAYPARAQAAARSDRGPYLVAGSMFTKYIKLDTTVARRWVPVLEDDILCVYLDRPSQEASGPRSGTTAAVGPAG